MGAVAGSFIGAILGAAGVFLAFFATPLGIGVCEHGCSLGLYFLIGAVVGAALGGAVGSAFGSGYKLGPVNDPANPNSKR